MGNTNIKQFFGADSNQNNLIEIARYDTAGTHTFIPDFEGIIEVYFCGAGGKTLYGKGGNAAHHQAVLKVNKDVEIPIIVGAPRGNYGTGGTTSVDGLAALGGAGSNSQNYSSVGKSTLSLNLGVIKDITIPHGILTPWGENPPNGKGDTLRYPSTNATQGIVVIYKRSEA